ncbi:MAG: hypothetical protein D8M57_04055 [Candidatus Scalindua sp. AMX11]|nr:MAG: hypothetical protein DWQ00_10640 [Candidatus Scalindua sp.]NOG82662.1 hypothetical protein [Planctomycetota bacterium]RZV95237.1 MAG: hypothetical protein EX341_02580 [Candidatus Scalindua sp. SCAELEC01]TDE66284.1 MAG: hypothetical protein D8M57_04055 [Candidatus Scalindua sp. AMX11]GJQ57907.1 MAG: hypothetical protein SCALA701_07080 [Candidatus Scalindua sp.]
MKHGEVLAYIANIYEQMVKQIEPAYLITPEELEFAPLTKREILEEGEALDSLSKLVAVSIPNKIYIKPGWGGFKEVRHDLIIQAYSMLIEAKNKVPNKIMSNSIPHIIILSDNQKLNHKIEIMIWQQLFEKGDVFFGRRACLHHKSIPPISASDSDFGQLGEKKQEIDLGTYWAGYIATYALANDQDILEVYCSFLGTLLSDKIIKFPVF